MQEHVWKTRNKEWIPVEGERAAERAARPPAEERMEQMQEQRIKTEPKELLR